MVKVGVAKKALNDLDVVALPDQARGECPPPGVTGATRSLQGREDVNNSSASWLQPSQRHSYPKAVRKDRFTSRETALVRGRGLPLRETKRVPQLGHLPKAPMATASKKDGPHRISIAHTRPANIP